MKPRDKEEYLESYDAVRSRGPRYFPEIMVRDVFVALVVVLLLVALAAWAGTPLDDQADPLDTTYVPRPEWYFFFIFQLLRYFPGESEVIGVVVIPVAATAFLLILPFLDRSRHRHYSRRPVPVLITYVLLIGACILTLQAALDAPPPASASELVAAGADPVAAGAALFAADCAACHGTFGEGGVNPAQPGDVIAPISTAEYLGTRDDATLRTIIEQGQPSFGMAPFGVAFGGPLSETDVTALVAFLRSWETDPPVTLPVEVAPAALSQNADYLYPELCAQCHGPRGEGGIGPSFADPAYQAGTTDEALFDSINLGHPSTAMIAWGDVLNAAQIEGLVAYIRGLGARSDGSGGSAAPTFAGDVLPVFAAACNACHGTSGGWNGTSYDLAVGSGDHGPVVVAGDPDHSVLAQMMRGTHPGGIVMPPAGPLAPGQVQLVVDWIAAGAPQ